jgi:zinc-binding alcohol dehydrogenase family protein
MTDRTVKAVGYQRAGDPTVLEWVERPQPEPGAHDLIVRVKAVSVNPADVKIRASATPADGTARILGFDAAGIVERVGSAVTRFAPGDEVFYAGAIDRPGSDAELQAIDERIVGHKPASLSWTQAAALPLTTLTAWELLFDRMRVPFGAKTAGGALLVINGAGGVGSMLTQLARRLTGLTVVATASRPETIAWCTRMGAHHVVNHHKPLDEEMARIGIPQAEYVAGLTATDRHLPAIAKLIAPQGVLALIDDPKTLDIVPFKTKAATVAWEFMFTRPKFGTPDMARQGFILDETAALVDTGLIETTLTRTFGALAPDTLAEAHAFVESAKGFGKVVLPGIGEEKA